MTDNRYDIIIIGAGIGGLICGCFLSKAGMKTLIIEQNDRPGGCVTSIKKYNYIFDMGAHLFGSCNKYGVFGQCLSSLDIDIDFIRINPADHFTFPNDIVKVPTSIEEYTELLKEKFPYEATNIEAFFRDLFFIAKNFVNPKFLKKYCNTTYKEYLHQYFNDDRLKGILSAQHLYIGTTPKQASLLFMAVLMFSYLKDGIYYPKGGTQKFSDILYDKFTEYGGESIFLTRVSKILMASKKAIGVETDNGRTFFGNVIISNGDALHTFYDLVGNHNLPDSYVYKLNKYEKSIRLFLTFLALENIKIDLSSYRGWYFSTYDMESDDLSPFYIFIPTLHDSSIAPEGIHILEAVTKFPYDFDKVRDWEECKKELQEKTMARLKKIMGSIHESIRYIDSASPKTMERYTSNSAGAIYGWKMSPSQTGINRLPQETPIENLYLVGHWTVPGCGITSVAVSGWQLARKLINRKVNSNIKT